MGANTKVFTDQNFETEVISSPIPVLVDFWAPWCGPCRMIAPMIEELAKEHGGSISVGKVDIDENRGVSERYNVQSIPTLMVFKGGQPVQTFVGVQPKSKVQAALEAAKGG